MPSSTAPASAFSAIRAATVAQIQTNARGVLQSEDAEFLHQLRVGLRRLRAELRAFRTILPRKPARRLRRALCGLSPVLGEARDWDVLTHRLEAAGADANLITRARAQRDHARRAARIALDSKAFDRLIDAARSIAAEESKENLAQFGAGSLSRAHRKLMKQARGIDWSEAATRHKVRIRVKRLRYSVEFFAPAFPARRSAAYLSALKELQKILGELNDISVGRRLIGYDADEAALLRRLDAAWARFAKRRAFWRARA